MATDIRTIKKQFEKSMDSYDKNAVVQKMTADKMVIELSKIKTDFENVLELGTGTGLLTKYLVKNINFKNYYANDIVEKSRYYVEKIVKSALFLYGNALKIKMPKKVDLIISNAMFQWFGDFNKAIEILKLSLEKDGILAFSTFSPDNFKEVKSLTGLSLSYKTQGELEDILKSNGFEILYSETFYEQLTFKTPLELLAHMKLTGVNSLTETTWSVKKIKDFCDKFSKKYKKISLTYAPIIILARKL